MSLFVTNRYEGEKEETKNERNHLSELLKRIEERKVERATKISHQIHESISQNAQESNHKKKKKKAENVNKCSKENINLDENSIPSDIERSAEVYVSEHRKSKKKRKDVYSVRSTNEPIKIADKTLQSKNTDNQDNEIPNESSDSNETLEKISGQNSDFIILGVKNKGREREVKRILADWLANPEVMCIDLNSGPTLEDMKSILDSKLIELELMALINYFMFRLIWYLGY